MNLLRTSEDAYMPTYTRTDLIDSLHEKFNFRTNYEIIENKYMKKILKDLKK